MGIRERAAITRRVGKKIVTQENVLAFGGQDLEIYLVKDFIKPDERLHLKALIKNSLERSKTLGDEYPAISEFRTSSTSNMDGLDAVVERVDARIAELTGIAPQNGELTQGQHYNESQTFRAHCDFMHESQSHWKIARREGGQRVWTAMAYLDDEMVGGDTKFIRAGFSIKPVAGMLVLWSNMTRDGHPNWLTLHEGAPVEKGEKTIITKWYRERRWGRPATGERSKAA